MRSVSLSQTRLTFSQGRTRSIPTIIFAFLFFPVHIWNIIWKLLCHICDVSVSNIVEIYVPFFHKMPLMIRVRTIISAGYNFLKLFFDISPIILILDTRSLGTLSLLLLKWTNRKTRRSKSSEVESRKFLYISFYSKSFIYVANLPENFGYNDTAEPNLKR